MDRQYSSSAAACNGASPTYGARQPRDIQHCKQHRLSARVRPFFDRKHRLHFGSFANSRVLSSVTWPIPDLFRNAVSCRIRFARDARQRRDNVARRRHGWRSNAHTVSPCGYANRRCVWSTDAAHLASIVCRQPPKKSSKDRSKPLWTRRVAPFRDAHGSEARRVASTDPFPPQKKTHSGGFAQTSGSSPRPAYGLPQRGLLRGPFAPFRDAHGRFQKLRRVGSPQQIHFPPRKIAFGRIRTIHETRGHTKEQILSDICKELGRISPELRLPQIGLLINHLCLLDSRTPPTCDIRPETTSASADEMLEEVSLFYNVLRSATQACY
jgi:hypothetical protein